MSLSSLVSALAVPGLLPVVLLTLGVIVVNGWTDAPNAIATAVSTKALTFPAAAVLAAVCNLLGALLSTVFFPAVTKSVLDLAQFGGDRHAALWALCAAMTSIVVWSTAAWYFGIPTSESHGLLAGLTGAALALEGGAANVDLPAWSRVWVISWPRSSHNGRSIPEVPPFIFGLSGLGPPPWLSSMELRTVRNFWVFSSWASLYPPGGMSPTDTPLCGSPPCAQAP